MRVINKLKRIIAGILSAVIIITIVPNVTAYAETEEFDVIEKVQMDLQAEAEIEQEARYDMMYGNN